MKENQQLKGLPHAKEQSPKSQKQSSTKAAPSKQTNHHVIEAAKQTQRFQLAPPEDDPISESDSERSQRSVSSEDEPAGIHGKSKNKSSKSDEDSGETKRKAKQNTKSAPNKSAKDEFWTSNSDSRRRYFAEVDAFVLETEPAL